MSNFNFNNLNDYTNIEEEIRPPDNQIREVLVNNNCDYDYISDYYDSNFISNDQDYELQLAINKSIKEQEEHEKKQLEIMKKSNLRLKSFKDVLFKIKKISMLDKQVFNFYNIIEPIINSYCECNIDIYKCNKDMYNEIFSTLKTIRITVIELELFKKLIRIED